jgi:NADH-quinone oxidoreductase subunit A
MLAQVSEAVDACAGQAECVTSYSDFLRNWLTVGIFVALGFVMAGAMLGIAMVLRPASGRRGRFQQQKFITYESGVDPVGWSWTQTQVRYYIFALLFVLFDVEAVFIFPWATRLEVYDVFGLVEMLIFIAILALGLVYAVRKKVLQWL